VRAGARDSEWQVHGATMLERESCPRAAGGVKRSEAARRQAPADDDNEEPGGLGAARFA